MEPNGCHSLDATPEGTAAVTPAALHRRLDRRRAVVEWLDAFADGFGYGLVLSLLGFVFLVVM